MCYEPLNGSVWLIVIMETSQAQQFYHPCDFLDGAIRFYPESKDEPE